MERSGPDLVGQKSGGSLLTGQSAAWVLRRICQQGSRVSFPQEITAKFSFVRLCSARIVWSHARLQTAPGFVKNTKSPQAPFLQSKLHRGHQNSQTVLHAAAEVDGRRF